MWTPILLGLSTVGCIVPAEPGFTATQRLDREVTPSSASRSTSWRTAQEAAAEEPPGLVDRALTPADSTTANGTTGDASPGAPTVAGAPTAADASVPGETSRADAPTTTAIDPHAVALPAGEPASNAAPALASTGTTTAPSGDAPSDARAPGDELPGETAAAEPVAPDPVVLREAAAALEEPLPPCDLVGLTGLFGAVAGAPSTVEDLVMSAEEGRVLTVRLRSGEGSGEGSEPIALPFDAFRFDLETRRIEARADLAELVERAAPSEEVEAEGDETRTPYVELFEADERTLFTGTVMAIEISRPDDVAEDYVFLKARDENNHLQRVLLGPVWFVMPNTWIATGSETSVRGVATRDARGSLLVAEITELGATRLELRDAEGRAAWLDPDPETPEVTRVAMHSLLARDVYVDGEVWGSVTDIVLEGRSGTVRFLCARSVVEELAGRWVVVPWSRVALEGERIALDVNALTLGASPSISAGETADLEDPDLRDRILRYFEGEDEAR